VRTLLILALLTAPALAAPPTTCGGTDDYSRALCAYQRRQFGDAERLFRALADTAVESPQTIRAHYFLARTMMKTGRWSEAEGLFRRIYELDATFYSSWNCDFLLGECRKALGKG
jgi:TolA-binding protein